MTMTVQNNTDVSSVKHENRRRDSPYPLAVAVVVVVAVAVAAAGSSGGGGSRQQRRWWWRCLRRLENYGEIAILLVRAI